MSEVRTKDSCVDTGASLRNTATALNKLLGINCTCLQLHCRCCWAELATQHCRALPVSVPLLTTPEHRLKYQAESGTLHPWWLAALGRAVYDALINVCSNKPLFFHNDERMDLTSMVTGKVGPWLPGLSFNAPCDRDEARFHLESIIMTSSGTSAGTRIS